MKKTLIVGLVCVNIVLVAMLINYNLNKAQAQTERGANNFIMTTGLVEPGLEGVYVIDLKTRKMGVWRFDRTAKKLVPYKGRILTTDFK
jgi:hypothetical protein